MKKLTAHQKKAFAILTKADRNIVKKEVVEVQDKVAMIPSFVGKHISMLIQPSSRFYHRSVRELRMEEEARVTSFVYQ